MKAIVYTHAPDVNEQAEARTDEQLLEVVLVQDGALRSKGYQRAIRFFDQPTRTLRYFRPHSQDEATISFQSYGGLSVVDTLRKARVI